MDNATDVKENLKFNPASIPFQQEEIKKEPIIKPEVLQLKKEDVKDESRRDEPLIEHSPPPSLQLSDQKPTFKTELGVPKVTVDKPVIKEELDSSNDASLLSISSKEDSSSQPSNHSLGNYKDSPLYMHSNMNLKESISFGKYCFTRWQSIAITFTRVFLGMKDPPLINHLQPNHALNLKDNKEQIVNMNHSSYLKDGRPTDQPFGYQGREPPRLVVN